MELLLSGTAPGFWCLTMAGSDHPTWVEYSEASVSFRRVQFDPAIAEAGSLLEDCK